MYDELDEHLRRPADRALCARLLDLPGLVGPREPSAPSGSRDDPIPGWKPYRITGTKEWGSQYKGDTSKLPATMVGLWIIVTDSQRNTWATCVTGEISRSDKLMKVRDSGKPKP